MAEKKEKNILNDVKDETKNFDKKEIESGKGMAILSYFGILALIPLLAEKKNKYVQFHAKQGTNLCIIWAAYIVIYNILCAVIKVNKSVGTFYGYNLGTYKVTPWWVTLPLSLVGLAIGVIALMGLIYAIQGKAKELPIVNKLKIIK